MVCIGPVRRGEVWQVWLGLLDGHHEREPPAEPAMNTPKPDYDTCLGCGGHLSEEPTVQWHTIWVAWEDVLVPGSSVDGAHAQFVSYKVPREATAEEIADGTAWAEDHGPWWDCPSCGRRHEAGDMYAEPDWY